MNFLRNVKEETDRLINETSKLLINNNCQESLNKMTEDLIEVTGNKEDKIVMAFIGQYSAGKSTIIKALTGDSSIVVDSDIATSKTQNYEWGQIILVDTPGLNTNENAMHDEMALDAIKKADLVVYCITSDLFHEVTRDDFKKLSIDYKSKMFLIINKMSKESGDYEVLVENYTDSINKTLAPEYSLNDYHHFFVDAADYLTGILEEDDDYIEDSHFEKFVEKLNNFIRMRGKMAQLSTPLLVLKSEIDGALDDIEEDEHVKEGIELIKRVSNIVEEKKRKFSRISSDEVQRVAHKFIQKGDEVVDGIGEKGFSFNDDDLQRFAEPLQDALCKSIADYFEKYAKEVDEEVQRIMESEQAIHFFEEDKQRLEKDYKYVDSKTGETFGKIQAGLGEVTKTSVPKISSMFAKWANVKDGQKITIWTVNGSDLHSVVKKVGNKLGYKFKPFEALKISKRIAEFSKWLGPILTGVGTVVELLGMLAEHNAEKKLAKAREGVRITFKVMAEETEAFYIQQVNDAAKEFDAIRDGLDEELERIIKESQNNLAFKENLIDLRQQITKLQKQIEYGEQ